MWKDLKFEKNKKEKSLIQQDLTHNRLKKDNERISTSTGDYCGNFVCLDNIACIKHVIGESI